MKKFIFGRAVTSFVFGAFIYGAIVYWLTKDKIGINLLDGVTFGELKEVVPYLFWGVYQEHSILFIIPGIFLLMIGGAVGEYIYNVIFESQLNKYEELGEELLDQERIRKYLQEMEEYMREQEAEEEEERDPDEGWSYYYGSPLYWAIMADDDDD